MADNSARNTLSDHSSSRQSSPDGVFEVGASVLQKPRDGLQGGALDGPQVPSATNPVPGALIPIDPALLAVSEQQRRTGQFTIRINSEKPQKRPQSDIDSSDEDSESDDDDSVPTEGDLKELAQFAASLGLKPETQHALKLFTKVRGSRCLSNVLTMSLTSSGPEDHPHEAQLHLHACSCGCGSYERTSSKLDAVRGFGGTSSSLFNTRLLMGDS